MRRHGVGVWAGLVVLIAFAAACTGGDAAGDAGGIEPIEVTSAEGDAPDDGDGGGSVEVAGEDEDAADSDGSADGTHGTDRGPFDFDDPSEIDEAYVDRVMAELFSAVGDLLADVLAVEAGPPLAVAASDSIAALYSGPRLGLMQERYEEYATDALIRRGFLPISELGKPLWNTELIVHAEDRCIVAVGDYDLHQVATLPFADEELAAVVLERDESVEALRLGSPNPTGWQIHEQAQLVRGENRTPVTLDEVSELDFAGALSLPCDSFGEDR